ncbi:MAG: DUF952 domain-containing protein [Phenylobacterium sp.]|uniref:DUF952 domain-containing protein n=1 Tax=Phenylobacterium sp. TaxID=1871053 RepID=UPI00272EF4E2|nr:DUF952 domain-containing protein [Phenylobacterium sp.]MDP2010195.1 DUF952 domain-containing protein [Phenylobacterium sp.]
MTRIYKILSRAEWTSAEASGSFLGSAVDLADGFIHFSTAAQAGETARRYFKDLTDLVVLEVEGDDLGPALRWEPSRGGDLFPHLYNVLTPTQVRAVTDASLGADGVPILGDLA